MIPLRILYVAYPLNPVHDASCGGAEQMLYAVERGIAERGHATWVAACAGSRVTGQLFATCDGNAPPDAFGERDAQHNAAVLAFVRSERAAGRPFSLIHDQGGSFWRHAEEISEPVLLTAHLGRGFYGDELANPAAKLFVNCVSESQRASFADVPGVVGVVPNGIDVDAFEFGNSAVRQSGNLVWLGRICEEKGPHLAIDAGQRCGLPVVIVGDVYPFSYHRRYFERAVLPYVDGLRVKFIRQPPFATKTALLRQARAVLIPSLVDETSSLVAMEAAAAGAPVIAFRRGALPEVVVEGKTGFVVENVEEMAAAVARLDQISPQQCRAHAEQHFRSERMIEGYERLYHEILRAVRPEIVAPA